MKSGSPGFLVKNGRIKKMSRKIIHVDMDAFYAAVEQRDFPELKGLPVIVGGQPDSRGVVATCSYEARKFGIHSAMPCSRAYQLCPQGVFVKPRFSAYKQASEEIHSVFREFTNMIEPLSLDEAYLDVSHVDLYEGSASLMAKEIRRQIFKTTQLSASAGISYNKFLAKLASDVNKPCGQFLIKPGQAEIFLSSFPIGKFYGVGKVTEKKMQLHGINTGADLKQKSMQELLALFGNSAEYYYDIARGIDDREVVTHRIRKSLGAENTFQKDLGNFDEMVEQLKLLAIETLDSLSRRDLMAYTITIKVKYADFKQVTRSYTSATVISVQNVVFELLPILLGRTEVKTKKVRLLGVSFSGLVDRSSHVSGEQLSLFGE